MIKSKGLISLLPCDFVKNFGEWFFILIHYLQEDGSNKKAKRNTIFQTQIPTFWPMGLKANHSIFLFPFSDSENVIETFGNGQISDTFFRHAAPNSSSELSLLYIGLA